MAKSSADGVELVAPFLTAARRRPSLGRREEEELTRRWVIEGDRASANSLARAHQRQVLALAIKYRHYQVPINELVAEGNLGLVRALQKFRPERGVRFGTYASYWIRAFIFDRVIKSRSAMVGDGGALRSSLFFKLRRERARVATQHGEGEVAEQALAERLGLSGSKLKGYLQRIDSREVSLEAEGPGGAPSEVDRLSSSDDQEVELSRLETAAGLRDTVKDALHLLDERERFIVKVRVMADGAEQLSLAEIARRLKVSRERARQLETRALAKLRRSIGATTNPIVQEWLANEHPQAPSA